MCISAHTGVFSISDRDYFLCVGKGSPADAESLTSHTPVITFSLMKLNKGQIVFIIENGMRVREASVLRSAAGFVTIRFENG